MPTKAATKQASVKESVLWALKQQGADSTILDCRLAYIDAAQLLGTFIRPMLGVERIYPEMLPTQASGRWSTTNPPLANFPVPLRNVVMPDPGWYWIEFDYQAIEARLAAIYSHDTEDLAIFQRGEDIHTITACKMLGLPLPKNLVDPYSAPEDAEWRKATGLTHKDHPIRGTFKAARYSLAYGTDAKAILRAKDIDRVPLPREEILKLAQAYLEGKPNLVAYKDATWDECLRTRVSREPFGRRRRLFPTYEEIVKWRRLRIPGEAAREGLNHKFQGCVASLTNQVIIKVSEEFPAMVFVVNRHDGLTFAFPLDACPPEPTLQRVQEIAEGPWPIYGERYRFPCDYAITWDTGRKEKIA